MALWTPASTTTAAWFDASDASTITSSGGAVSQWNDKSGNSYNLTQGTGASQPVTGSGTINSLNAMTWTTAKVMSSAAPAGANWQDVYVVAKWTGAGTFSTYNGLFTSTVTGGSGNGIGLIGHSGSVNAYSSNWWDNIYLNGTSWSASNLLPTMASDFVVDFSANSAISVTGVMVGHDRTYSGRGWEGLIGEVIAFNSKLSTADRQKTEGYLAWKWGTEGSLPAAHPYKSAAPTQIGITSITPATGPGATTTSVTIAGTDFTNSGAAPSAYWRLNDASSGAATTAAAGTGGQALAIANSTWGTSTVGTSRNVLNVSTTSTAGTASLSLGSSSTFSISAWVYPTANSVNVDAIWILTNSHSGVGTWLTLVNSSTTPQYSDGSAWHSASSSLTLNAWSHLVVVVSGTALAFYINGAAAGTATVTSRTWSGAHFYAGYTPSYGAGGHFQGKFAEFAAWSGAALSASEVADVYGSGTPPDITTGIPGETPTVTIDGEPCTSVSVASAISLTCNTPLSFTAGAKDVVATNSTGTATLAGGFTYAAPLLDRQQVGSVFQDWRRAEAVEGLGSVFTEWRRSETVDTIGSVFQDWRRSETVDTIGSVMAVPALPSTSPSLTAPSYYWKFNDNAASTTVVAATGSQNATASVNTSVMSVAGVTGTALQCQSSGSQNITLASGTTYVSSNVFSMSIWLYPDGTSGTDRYVWDSAIGNGKLSMIRDNQTLRMYIYPGGNVVTTGNVITAAGQWYHILYTQDGTDAKIYINGSLSATGSGTGDETPAISTNGLTVGRHATNGSKAAEGRLDDFTIWDGTALSATEVAAVYGSGTPPDITTGLPGGPNPTKHYFEKTFMPGMKNVWFM